MPSSWSLRRRFGSWIFAATAAATLMTVGAAAQKRLALEQEQEGPLAVYRKDVRALLKDLYEPDIRLRAVVLPSFETEYAVGLRQLAGGWEIVTLRLSRTPWAYQIIDLMKRGKAGSFRMTGADGLSGEMVDTTAEEIERLQKGLPANPAEIPVTRCSAPIGDEVADALVMSWSRMLSEARPEKDWMGGLDGTTYLFSMEQAGRSMAAETWSPKRGTRPAKMATIAESLFAFCESRDESRLQSVAMLANGLSGKSRPGN